MNEREPRVRRLNREINEGGDNGAMIARSTCDEERIPNRGGDERHERAQRTGGSRRPTESLAGELKGRCQPASQPVAEEAKRRRWFANLHHATSSRP